MKRFSLKRPLVVMLTLLFVLCQATWVLAGTTGGLGGQVTDDSGTPVAAADVKVVSASQSATATTDATGHFAFLSLAPDTYTVSIEKHGYNPISYAGVSVFADNQLSLSFKLTKALREIAKVSARAAGALIKAGTTADVYSVNATTSAKMTGLGGGSGLDNAYSAIASVPGAFVPLGTTAASQMGWFQTVIIRGGGFDQVGYEVDGVPVNRAFDNYPSSTASALGQQELQVYTGASPANAEGQGLSGFINQVVRTGTYPGFASSDLGIGGPTFYHKANVEVGGATPDRLFSYYAGFGGYNQDARFFDQSNGAGISGLWGAPIEGITPAGGCTAANSLNYDNCYANGSNTGPGGFLLAGLQYGGNAALSDREAVMNFHFALPHHADGGRDDIQLLYQTSEIRTFFYNSPSDIPASVYAADPTLAGTQTFASGYQYTGAIGQPLAANPSTSIVPYGYPSRPYDGVGGAIPSGLRDNNDNGIGVVKLQYQKNFGSSAYLRVYGYTLYSNWFLYGPNTTWANFVGPNPSDYELESHTRGVSATFAKQLNPRNLLQIQGSYTTATSLRSNNTQATNGSLVYGLVVNQNDPFSGICYTTTGTATACSTTEGGSPEKLKIGHASSLTSLPGLPASCGTGPCEWLAVENGQKATYNTVTPKFTAVSITDEWDPSDRLHFNLGLRMDRFEYDPGSTNGAARSLFFNSWNNAMCVDAADGVYVPVAKTNVQLGCNDPVNVAGYTVAPKAGTYTAATLSNTNSTSTRNLLQPRFGATFTINPQNVLRLSYGKYVQAPNAAFYQYNTLQQDLPDFIGPRMYAYGRTQPTFDFPAQVSFNSDLSWEHQLKGTDMSLKLTPFYRKTQDQVQQFPLDPKTGFVSGLNVGNQTSQGVEFQFQKGDFSRNGWAAMLSYTYTNAKIKYQNFSNGGSVLDTINQGITQYNSYTSYCAANPNDSRCGGAAQVKTNAAPCYSGGAAVLGSVANPALCTAATVANPYWNAPVQGLMDRNGSYAPYATFPGNIGVGSYSSFVSPNVATLVLNYKHDRFAITPAVQYSSGVAYGYPLGTQGVDPLSCGALTSGPDAARYPYGAAGSGNGYDAVSCGGLINIPNPDSGKFDTIGAFKSPSRWTGNLQLTYEASPRVTAVATLTNIFDVCTGGTTGAWTNVPGVSKSKVCGYTAGGFASSGLNPVGNVYNPGATIQPFVAHTYAPAFGSLPFNAYFDLKIKL